MCITDAMGIIIHIAMLNDFPNWDLKEMFNRTYEHFWAVGLRKHVRFITKVSEDCNWGDCKTWFLQLIEDLKVCYVLTLLKLNMV